MCHSVSAVSFVSRASTMCTRDGLVRNPSTTGDLAIEAVPAIHGVRRPPYEGRLDAMGRLDTAVGRYASVYFAQATPVSGRSSRRSGCVFGTGRCRSGPDRRLVAALVPGTIPCRSGRGRTQLPGLPGRPRCNRCSLGDVCAERGSARWSSGDAFWRPAVNGLETRAPRVGETIVIKR